MKSLLSLSPRLVDRDIFLDQLEEALTKNTDLGSWSDWKKYLKDE